VTGREARSVARTVWLKELRDLFRDGRTVALNVLVPLVLFPMMFLVLDANVDSRVRSANQTRRVAIQPGATAPAERALLDGFTVVPGASVDLVAEGVVPVLITRDGAILFNERSERSTAVAGEVHARLTPARRYRLEGVYGSRGAGTGASLLAVLVLLASLVGPLPAALDLGAGEKQRFSLELLLTTTSRRGAIVVGKAGAILITALLSVAAFGAGLALAGAIVPELFVAVDLSALGDPLAIAGVVALVVVAAALLSSVELLISLYSRSPREAQSLVLPLLIVVSVAAYSTMLTDLWYAPAALFFVPLLNIGLALKAIVLEAPIGLSIAAITLENIALIVVSLYLGTRLLGSERVLERS
jgi:sodium transport system permease protein